jgi:excisionase family DNA binding protein
MTDSPRRLLGVADLAEHLGLGQTKVRELIRAGDIHAVKVGRRLLVSSDEVDRFIDTLHNEAV